MSRSLFGEDIKSGNEIVWVSLGQETERGDLCEWGVYGGVEGHFICCQCISNVTICPLQSGSRNSGHIAQVSFVHGTVHPGGASSKGCFIQGTHCPRTNGWEHIFLTSFTSQLKDNTVAMKTTLLVIEDYIPHRSSPMLSEIMQEFELMSFRIGAGRSDQMVCLLGQLVWVLAGFPKWSFWSIF